MCAVILHNMLIGDDIPDEWLQVEPLDEDDELNNEVSDENDDERRKQLLAYILEQRGYQISK